MRKFMVFAFKEVDKLRCICLVWFSKLMCSQNFKKSRNKNVEGFLPPLKIFGAFIIVNCIFRYMAITFYQAILAFCLQDGPEALTQVSTVDIHAFPNCFNLRPPGTKIVRQ